MCKTEQTRNEVLHTAYRITFSMVEEVQGQKKRGDDKYRWKTDLSVSELVEKIRSYLNVDRRMPIMIIDMKVADWQKR